MRARHWSEGRLAVATVALIDLIAVFDAFALGYLCHFRWGFLLPPRAAPAPVSEYIYAWTLAGAIALLLFHAYGLYRSRVLRDPVETLGASLKAMGFALLFVLSLSYFYRQFTYSRVAIVYTGLFGIALVGGFRWSWATYRRWVRSDRERARPVVLVGSRQLPRFLARRLDENPGYGLRIAAVVDDVPIDASDFAGLPRGGLEELSRMIDRTGAEEVLVGHASVGHHALLEMIELCEVKQVRIRMVPATYDLLVKPGDFEEVEGIPLVTINESERRPVFRFAKRAFDIAAASALIVLTLPVLVAVACAIRRDGPGPILFRQRRVGRGGQPFEMIKFRTMQVDAEERLEELVDLDRLDEPVFKLDHDPRVTRVGRWLRRYSLDELPQLFNVLKGEMSLVGPRPEEERVVARYDTWERRRLKIKPGITGLQQIYCRGSKSLAERVRWDIVYLRRESWLLDFSILFRTVFAVASGKGAR